MALLKKEVPTLDEVEERYRDLYTQEGSIFVLHVDGIDDAKELKEALRKEREEKAAAKKRSAELEAEKDAQEQERQKEKGEFKSLWEKEQEQRTLTAKELSDLKDKIATGERENTALTLASSLTRDTAKAQLLKQQALSFIVHTPEGVKINGPDGSAWDDKKLGEHLTTSFPFLVDGNQASGGGASGGSNGGAGFEKMTKTELSKAANNPATASAAIQYINKQTGS